MKSTLDRRIYWGYTVPTVNGKAQTDERPAGSVNCQRAKNRTAGAAQPCKLSLAALAVHEGICDELPGLLDHDAEARQAR